MCKSLYDRSIAVVSALAIVPRYPASDAVARPRRGAPKPTPDRRQAILLAAEQLFAERGYHAVTIRQIAAQAGVPLALVGYYFGPKHQLFHAIFAHWNYTIEARLAGLASVPIDPADRRTLPRIIQAFTGPVLELRASAEGEYYALLVARELAYRSPESDRVLSEFFDPLAAAFIKALQHACPGSSRANAAWAYQFSLGSLMHHISDHRIERLSDGAALPGAPDAADRLIAFITAGIAAVLGGKKQITRASATRERGVTPSSPSSTNTTTTSRRRIP